MPGIELPGMQFREPSLDAQFIVQQLGQILMGISNQLDLLIQLESGFLEPEEMQQLFRDGLEKARQAAGEQPDQNGQANPWTTR